MDQCRNNETAGADTVWILASNSDTEPDNNVDEVLPSIEDFNQSRVQSMIMISDLYNRPASDSEINSVTTPQSLLSMKTKHASDI